MFKNYSNHKTPATSNKWAEMSEDNRKKIIFNELNKIEDYKDFEVVKAPDNGQIEIRTEKNLPANTRGLLLLDIEEMLKSKIDGGITVWCVTVGDKSKLRNLRGVKITT